MSTERFDIKTSINGDAVIGFGSEKDFKLGGLIDKAKVNTYFLGDKTASHTKYLGMVNLFNMSHNVSVPFMRDLFKGGAVLEVNPMESVTYDLPVTRTEVECYTAEDTSLETDSPGVDNSVFTLVLNQQYTKGDVLTYDPQYGDQVMVSNDHEVQQVGENYKHYVILMTNDKTKFFPKDKLKAGIKYMKLTNIIGEFDTDFSGINLIKNPAGYITNEFLLGDVRGVETSYSRKAAMSNVPGLKSFTDAQYDKIAGQIDAMGGKDMFFIAKGMPGGGFNKNSVQVGTTMEYLALMELSLMECNSLLFAKAATVHTSRGSKMLNEGIWHQIRRGKLIEYARPGAITFDHIHEAASYIFRGKTNIPVLSRKVKFKCGAMAYQNMIQLFREEATQQLGGLPAGMLGTDAQIGKVFSGPLDALVMNAVVIRTVQVPGIGWIEIEHDESLDYQPLADRYSAGFYGEGYAHTTYSMVMWDVTNPEYSNVDNVKGATVVEGGTRNANIYYIKTEGNHVTYGYEQGRMADESKFEKVLSNLKYMGRSFWCHSQSAALLLDVTKYVVIELQPKG